MSISTVNGIQLGDLSPYVSDNRLMVKKEQDTFDNVLSAAIAAIDEKYDLQNAAESEEIRFALGESVNTHDLLIAQTKASVALQYTVAVRNKMLDAYKEIMQMQI